MKKTSKIIILGATFLIVIFAISACRRKESTTSKSNTEEKAYTDNTEEIDEPAGGKLKGVNTFKVPEPTKVILTVNGEDVYYIEDEKQIEKITDILTDYRKEFQMGKRPIKEMYVDSVESDVNWMYELDLNNGSVPKIYFSEDGKYESWTTPGGIVGDGSDVIVASTGMVKYLKSLIN